MKIRDLITEAGMWDHKKKLDNMNPEELNAYFAARAERLKASGGEHRNWTAKDFAVDQEWRYGYKFPRYSKYVAGDFNHYPADFKYPTTATKHNYAPIKQAEDLDEGLKDWLKRMAAAGIIIGSVAGIGSINNAINNNVPVIQAMNKALDAATQKGDKQLIQNIKQDIDMAKISLDSGKDLNTVKQLQDRYAKFMPADYKPSTPAPKFKEAEEEKIDTLTIDVPMFIRLMEYAREDAKTDMDLHNVTTNLLKIKDRTISMDDYDEVVGAKADAAPDESFKDRVMKKIVKPIADYNKDKTPTTSQTKTPIVKKG